MIETALPALPRRRPRPLAAKVAQGIRDWRPDAAIGQYRMQGCNADMGLPDMTIAEAAAAGARTLVVGVANRGGRDLAGLDQRARRGAGARHGPRLGPAQPAARRAGAGRGRDGARPPAARRAGAAAPLPDRRRQAPAPAGAASRSAPTARSARCTPRSPWSARCGRAASQATFRATGQTGILITGDGVPLDAVVADFMAGAIEWLTPDNDPDHWDLIEGQGSLFHPSYSGVTLALIHGGQPDALVLCHEPTRPHMRGLPGYRAALARGAARPLADDGADRQPGGRGSSASRSTPPALDEAAALDLPRRRSRRACGLPAVDPFRQGAGRLVDALA